MGVSLRKDSFISKFYLANWREGDYCKSLCPLFWKSLIAFALLPLTWMFVWYNYIQYSNGTWYVKTDRWGDSFRKCGEQTPLWGAAMLGFICQVITLGLGLKAYEVGMRESAITAGIIIGGVAIVVGGIFLIVHLKEKYDDWKWRNRNNTKTENSTMKVMKGGMEAFFEKHCPIITWEEDGTTNS